MGSEQHERRRSAAFIVAILVGVLVLSIAAPAHSATRLRVYRGETSDGHRISFRVARTDTGRFVREIRVDYTLTCEDGATQEWGSGWGLSNFVPITDGEFTFDDVFLESAFHMSGHIGKLHGSGTFVKTMAQLTEEEQPQLCASGDLMWEVEYVRTIRRG